MTSGQVGFRAVFVYERELEKQEGNDKLKGCCSACSGYRRLAFGILFIVNSYSFMPQQCRVKSKLFSAVKDHCVFVESLGTALPGS